MNRREIIRQIVEIEAGIVPKDIWYSEAGSVNSDRWESLSESQKSVFKRKFRKLYRKACRRYQVDYSKANTPHQRYHLVNMYLEEVRKKVQFTEQPT